MVGFILVLFLLSAPDDRMKYSTDGKAPHVYATQDECGVELRKQALKLKNSRIPAQLACVEAIQRPDGVIVEASKG